MGLLTGGAPQGVATEVVVDKVADVIRARIAQLELRELHGGYEVFRNES
jgi:hypothetical protein